MNILTIREIILKQLDKLISGNIKLISMQDVLSHHVQQTGIRLNQQSISNDQEAQDLFNQIELNQSPLNINNTHKHPNQDSISNPFSQLQVLHPSPQKKLKKGKMEINSDEDDMANNQDPKDKKMKMKTPKKQKKLLKLEKKLEKKLKKKMKKKEKKERKLKKLRLINDGENGEAKGNKESDGQWSGQQDSFDEDSDVSSDSLFDRLNPSKKKLKTTQKKQGFKLKELGNDGQVELDDNQQRLSDGSEYEDRKPKKKKIQKKELTKNQQILKSLIGIGLCVEEENNERHEEDSYNNGIEEITKMKDSKKKVVKAANKMFADIRIEDFEQNNEPIPTNIQLEVKPRVNNGPSIITSSFLEKAQRIKKARGMESEMQNQQYQKIQALKTKQSMSQLIRKKEVGQAEQIELDITVPQFVKGKEHINNSIFLKKLSSAHSGQNNTTNETPKKVAPKSIIQKIRLNRIDFFQSIQQQVKDKKAKNFTEDLIKNNFKKTQLQQIQQMRKKNQQKRRRQAMGVSEEEEEEEDQVQQSEKKSVSEPKVIENTLGFMNFRVEIEDPEKNIRQHQKNKIQSMQQKIEQQEKKRVVSDIQLKKLIQLQERGEVSQEEIQEEPISQDSQKGQKQAENQEMIGLNQSQKGEAMINEDEEENEQIIQQNLDQAQEVQLQVELSVESSFNQSSQINIEQENQEKEVNQEYQEYLNQLQAQGIQTKKRTGKAVAKFSLGEKENVQKLQNQRQENTESQARRQFRKLRKLATVIKLKKKNEIKIKKVGQFFEEQAEEGSDNEEHDGQVKKINYDEEAKQYEGIDLDAELEELIDNAVNINEEDEDLAFKKYMQDIKLQDREELKRIMKGDFKRNRDKQVILEDMEDDDKKMIQRMEQIQEYIKQKQIEQGKELFLEQQKPEQAGSEQEQESDENGDRSNNKMIEKKNQENEDQQMYDEMNEQNLMRYLDQGIRQSFREKIVTKKTVFELPESYQRMKQTQKRNSIKPKQAQEGAPKMKKTSSHLNELIMKNKVQVKPLIFIKSFGSLSSKKIK